MRRYKQTATLQWLAKRLNMHVSTVSRVLNGSEGIAAKAASPATIARIRALAAECNYQPNPHAISLRKKQSHLIGVVVPRLSDYVWAAIYEGIEGTALEKGYVAYGTNSYDQPELRQRHAGIAAARLVDGLIVGDAHTTDETLSFLGALSLPFVLVLRQAGDFPAVVCDDYRGGQLAAQHLFERGHRKVGVLAGELYTATGQKRSAGFIDFYREAGYPLSPEKIVSTPFDTQGGRDGTLALLQQNDSLTGMFVVNDFAAIGAMGAMREKGIVPGRTMALVGYNDTPLAAALPIPLTTIRSPLREIGARAMAMLLRRLAGENVATESLEPALVVRESSSFEN